MILFTLLMGGPTNAVKKLEYTNMHNIIQNLRQHVRRGFPGTHCFFRLYLCFVTFGQNGPKLNSKPVYCSQLYGMLLKKEGWYGILILEKQKYSTL